jgi:hypothetical protein
MAVVASYAKPEEAHLARLCLESNGIEARVLDDLTASVYPGISGAIGGVRVEVGDADETTALAVLGRSGGSTPLVCPLCGSTSVKAHRPGPLTAIALGLDVAAVGRTLRATCTACGNGFRVSIPARRVG